jgi:serine/threonine-protein kinase
MDLGDAVTIRSSQVGSSSVAISPDGRRLVFLSFRQQVPRLMTRVLDQIVGATSVELPGTEGARGPFFSGDGRQVGFFAAGKLWKTRVDGGTPTPVAAAEELLGGSWGDDDVIVAALSTAGLVRVPAGGGTPEVISGAPPGARWPQVLPGSRAVLFTAGVTPVVAGALRVDVLSLSDGKVTTLVPGSYARYLASGHLAWVDRRTLFVAPFSLERLQLTGPGVAVIDDIALNMYNSAEFDVSQTGTFVCRCGPGGDDSVVQWLDQSGTATPLLPEPAEYSVLRLSPDASRIAFVMGRNGNRQDLRIFDLRSGRTNTLGTAGPSRPVWTPDGRFLVGVGASGEVRWMTTDGSAAAGTLVPPGDAIQIPWSFDDDGSHLAFYQRGTRGTGSKTFDLWTVPVTIGRDSMTAGKPEPFLVSDFFEVYPAFSPDGRWIAYTSLESGAYEIYVRAFPDKGQPRQISAHGGTVAAWARDGRRLFYQTAEQRIMVVDWSVSDGVSQPGQPRYWTDTRLADVGLGPSFDVAPDGRVAALMIPLQSPSRQPANQVTLVLNLFSELRLRAPR